MSTKGNLRDICGANSVLSASYINADGTVVIQSCGSVGCCHWEELGKRYVGSLYHFL